MSSDGRQLTFEVLGRLRAVRSGVELSLGPPQRQAVLAVLLLRTGRLVTASELAQAIWELPPDGSNGIVRSHISRLRGVLGKTVIESVSQGYLLQVGPDDLDLLVFERLVATGRAHRSAGRAAEAVHSLRAALALVNEPILGAVSGPFAAVRRSQLEQRRVDVLEQCLTLEVSLGRHLDVVEELVTAAAAYPTREGLVHGAMTALHLCARTTEAFGIYHFARAALRDSSGMDPGESLRTCYQRLLEVGAEGCPADPSGSQDPSSQGVVNEALRGLPPGPAILIGRDPELARISAAGSGGLVAIDGMAGVGKTSLALSAAAALEFRFPDGQLFVNLRGHAAAGQPMTPDDAVDTLLRSVGRPPDPAAPFEQRCASWRSAVADKQLVLVFDDAADVEQIRLLLPRGRSLTIVTSRRRLTSLIADVVISLSVLDEAGSVALLASVIGAERIYAEPEHAGRLATVCGGLPLALTVAAARLRHRSAWGIGHLVDRLRDEQGRLSELDIEGASVRAALSLSFAMIDPPARRLLRLLADLPLTELTADAAAALGVLVPSSAEQRLESLLDVNLLLQHAPGRYRIHDLVRAYARSLPAEADDRAYQDLLLDHYVHALHRCIELTESSTRPLRVEVGPATSWLAERIADTSAAVDWLEHEFPAVIELIVYCRERGRPRHCWQLAVLLAVWSDRAGLLRAMVVPLQHALDSAAQLTEPRAELHVRYCAAVLAYKIGLPSATDALDQLGQLAGVAASAPTDPPSDQIELRWLQGRALMVSAIAHQVAGDYGAATRLFHAARAVIGADDEATLMSIDHELAEFDRYQGRFAEGIARLEPVTARARELGLNSVLGPTCRTLGDLYCGSGDHAAAERSLRHALDFARTAGDRILVASTLSSLAVLATQRGERALGRNLHRQAQAASTGSGLSHVEAEIALAQSNTILLDGAAHEAVIGYRSALALATQNGDLRDQARARYGIGRCLELSGEGALAAENLRQAAELFEQLGVINPFPT